MFQRFPGLDNWNKSKGSNEHNHITLLIKANNIRRQEKDNSKKHPGKKNTKKHPGTSFPMFLFVWRHDSSSLNETAIICADVRVLKLGFRRAQAEVSCRV